MSSPDTPSTFSRDVEKEPTPSRSTSTEKLVPPRPRFRSSRPSTASSFTSKWDEMPKFAYFDETPYPGSLSSRSLMTSISQQFTLSHDPRTWGSDLSTDLVEPDDHLHNATEDEKAVIEKAGGINRDGHGFSMRGIANIGCLILMVLCLGGLFIGYPVSTYARNALGQDFSGSNLGGINGTGQVPDMKIKRNGAIDADTPQDAYTYTSLRDEKTKMELVFSDEFNMDGRSFYPGDDPYWEAGDFHYWATNNMEWYDPAAITTSDGSLVITLSEKETHDLHYQGGLMSTWNKFCFTGGLVVTSVQLPGFNNVLGLWPAVWTMGNLGRAGYGATLEGTWPYTYDACDVGTVANQSVNGVPHAATVDGDKGNGGVLSYLPGQRLSRCTCDGQDHPGPKHGDGTYVGRSAPEIDIFEAQINQNTYVAAVSQSAQWAPFNYAYRWDNTTDNMIIEDPVNSYMNDYMGGVTQQATSIITNTNPQTYERSGGLYAVYGFEYKPGFDDAYIQWVSDDKHSWTLNAAGVGADDQTVIAARPVPQEPMYLIANLGMSKNFGPVSTENLLFPVHMKIDWIRVYQPEGQHNTGCDPDGFPTAAYIEKHEEAYSNPNLTTWVDDYQQPWPKNSFLGEC